MVEEQRNLGEPAGVGAGTSLEELQAMVDHWIRRVGVRYFSELTNLAQLMEEVGELARIFSRTYGDQSIKSGERLSELSDELSDILFVLICIANQTGVDLQQAFMANLAKKSSRDHLRHQQNPKLFQNSVPVSDIVEPEGSQEQS